MIQAEKQNRNRQEPDPVLAAMEEWKMALNRFEDCTDAELVGLLSYGIEAAKRKYILLLNRSKN